MPNFNFCVLGDGNQNLLNVTPLLPRRRFLHRNTGPFRNRHRLITTDAALYF